MKYDFSMEQLFKIIGTVFNSALELAFTLLKAAFGIKDSVDSFQDLMLATVLGVPLWVVTLISGIITIVLAILRVYRKYIR